MIGLLVLCTIGLVAGEHTFKLQVDDTHYLYCDGTLLSTGERTYQAYTASTSKKCTSIAVFAENSWGGPMGIMLTIDGQPTDVSAWKCKTVANFADANSQNAGWTERNYDTSSWGSMVTIGGGWKRFEGGPWMWAQTGGIACICRLQLGGEIEFQVDDIHKLYDSNGELISSGHKYYKVYRKVGHGPLAIYAYNPAGPNGITMKVNGVAVDKSKIRCKSVTGTEAEIDADNPGWKNGDFDASTWREAVISSNHFTNKIGGSTKTLWAEGKEEGKVICKIDV